MCDKCNGQDMRDAIEKCIRDGGEVLKRAHDAGLQPIDILKACFALLDGVVCATTGIPAAKIMREDCQQAAGTVMLLSRRIEDGSMALGVASPEEASREVEKILDEARRKGRSPIGYMQDLDSIEDSPEWAKPRGNA